MKENWKNESLYLEKSLIEKLYECNLHKTKLLNAMGRLSKFMPLTLVAYNSFSIEDESFIDQLIFRFSKMQDTMGEKLFPLILELLGEEVKSKSFIDRLNRLEELELIDKKEWMYLRKNRNEIAHEYSFNRDTLIESINNVFESLNTLVGNYAKIYDYCFNKFDFLKEAVVLN